MTAQTTTFAALTAAAFSALLFLVTVTVPATTPAAVLHTPVLA